jgi:hypothetical protein
MSGEVPNHVRKKIRIFLLRRRPTDSVLEIEDGFCGAVADLLGSARQRKCIAAQQNRIGENRVEILASAVFIFGQPGLEQTPDAKSVARMQRGVTVRTLVRLERNRRKRISEAVEIHLGEVKFARAHGRESLSQALLRKPEGEVSKNRGQAHFRSSVAQVPDQRNGFCVCGLPYRATLPVLDCGGKHRARPPVGKRKDGELLPSNREFSSEIKLRRPFTCLQTNIFRHKDRCREPCL